MEEYPKEHLTLLEKMTETKTKTSSTASLTKKKIMLPCQKYVNGVIACWFLQALSIVEF